jgi:LytS/YehU family sensor histidine kinase
MKMLVVSADLAVLRARIRPHFLFNTLTAIAALCGIDPSRAEMSILRLGTLMRRSLEVDPTTLTSLESEMEYVQAYIDIQNVRFAGEIVSHVDVDAVALTTRLPAFCIQTLVENAFQHGFERWSGVGAVRITARRRRRKVMFAVQDSGRGMSEDRRQSALEQQDHPRHGLGIIDKELRLVFGEGSRLRVWSKEGAGTLVAFQVPLAAVREEVLAR